MRVPLKSRLGIGVLSGLSTAAILAACSLNPQPLPPDTANSDGSTAGRSASDSGFATADAGSLGESDAGSSTDVDEPGLATDSGLDGQAPDGEAGVDGSSVDGSADGGGGGADSGDSGDGAK